MVWLLCYPRMICNCLGMLDMLIYIYICIYIYIYIYINNGLPCMCDIIHEWNGGHRGSLACEINE